MKKIILMYCLVFVSLFWSGILRAALFDLPKDGGDMVGGVQYITAQKKDSFPLIAQRYNVTYTGLVEANPKVNPMHPGNNTSLTIPGAYLLPAVPHEGIVINLAELRLYYYPPHRNQVYTYPIGIGIEGWNIKPGLFKIIQKKKDPSWTATPDTRAELEHKGYHIPPVIPPGPDNPLGPYMMRLSNWTYEIHGCVDPATIGRRSSSGCFRMYNNNVEELFNLVILKTSVRVINEPYKVGWDNNKLYLEAHLPLQEQQTTAINDRADLIYAINHAIINHHSAEIDWDKAIAVAKQHLGIPEVIGTALTH